MLHLKYIVTNLVWEFEWNSVDGEEVDLTEKQEFFIIMKKPLRVKGMLVSFSGNSIAW